MKFITAYETDTQKPISLRARVSQRVTIPRERLLSLTPDMTISLRSHDDPPGLRGKSEYQLSEWLSNRYNRSWTPTEFDRRISKNVGRIQPCLKRLGSYGVEEIFVRVTPTDALQPNEPYEVGFIILVDPAREADLRSVQAESQNLARAIQQPGTINVVQTPSVALSSVVQYGTVPRLAPLCRYLSRFNVKQAI